MSRLLTNSRRAPHTNLKSRCASKPTRCGALSRKNPISGGSGMLLTEPPDASWRIRSGNAPMTYSHNCLLNSRSFRSGTTIQIIGKATRKSFPPLSTVLAKRTPGRLSAPTSIFEHTSNVYIGKRFAFQRTKRSMTMLSGCILTDTTTRAAMERSPNIEKQGYKRAYVKAIKSTGFYPLPHNVPTWRREYKKIAMCPLNAYEYILLYLPGAVIWKSSLKF